MPDQSPPAGGPRNYDLYFYAAGGSRFVLRNPNHGITVSDDGLSFTANGNVRSAAFDSIAAIHIQTAALGNGNKIIDQCKIEFYDDPAISVSNASASGLPDNAQTPIYRGFVHDLHARLAIRGNTNIRFTAGLPPWRYKMLGGALIAAALLFIVLPLGLAVFTHDRHVLTLAAAGISLYWPFTRLMMNNAPRGYTPDRLPEELMS